MTVTAPTQADRMAYREYMRVQVPGGKIAIAPLMVSQAAQRQAMLALDTNGDGSLSADEFARLGKNDPAAAASDSGQALFSALDRNGDGRLLLPEANSSGLFNPDNLQALLGVQDVGSWLVSLADQNGDGTLSSAEYSKYDTPPITLSVVNRNGEAVPTQIRSISAFNFVDTDRDGAITAEELNQQLQRSQPATFVPLSFSRATDSLVSLNDADGDGALSRDEIAATAAAANAPATGDAGQLLATADTDGDGRATAQELAVMAARQRAFIDQGRHIAEPDAMPTAADVLLARLLRATVERMTEQFAASLRTTDRTV